MTKFYAFYLPQFHPISENDISWGNGFTEWYNVIRAKKLFWGHQQPNLPGELSFYDLRTEETLVAQARLADEFGVDGFLFWHYWFGKGRRLLNAPFDKVLYLALRISLSHLLGQIIHGTKKLGTGIVMIRS
jgi:lipopolysaccharide biosynthesis protein